MTPLDKVAQQIASAGGSPEKLFGTLPADQKRTYRRLMGFLHPDKWVVNGTDAEKLQAGGMLHTVTEMWEMLQAQIGGRFTAVGHRYTYEMAGTLAKGDISNLYASTYWDPIEMANREAVFKLVRSPQNNDLMLAEASALKAISKSGSRRAVFASTFVETLRYQDPNHEERRANVVHRLDGYFSLAQIMEEYPDGLDIRDIVWIWRRCLIGLSLAHELGYVHGAVLPEHIMVQVPRHEVVLVDWCYSVKPGEKIKAMVPHRQSLYPQEVIQQEPADEGTDLAMLARTMSCLFNIYTPKQMHAFVKGCTMPAGRPKDAGMILRTLTDLIERLYGERQFRVFSMPRSRPHAHA